MRRIEGAGRVIAPSFATPLLIIADQLFAMAGSRLVMAGSRFVMAGLGPAIHDFSWKRQVVDARPRLPRKDPGGHVERDARV